MPFCNPFKFFDLVEAAKLMFRISAVSTVGCPRLMKFGLSLSTEFTRFTRTLELGSVPSSGKILFTSTSSIPNDSIFLSWVVEPWTRVSNLLTLSVQLSTFEVLSFLRIQTSSFNPGVPILLRSPLMFLLSRDVHIIFLLLSKDWSYDPITNASD